MVVMVAACGGAEDDEAHLLDGTAEIDEAALSDLASERARLGARWFAGNVREDGAFYYIYRPDKDVYELEEYNEVRHAAAVYALFQVYGAVGGKDLLEAGEQAAGYIEDHSRVVEGSGRAFVYEDRNQLGGQALALMALLERRRVTEDTRYDALIDDLAAFLLSMELEEEPGHYYMYYDPVNDRRLHPEPDVPFAPGEALLALTRLAQQFPEEQQYLEAAVRAADYLIHVRDGDIPAAGKIPEVDHWLTMALSELYRLDQEQDYVTVAYLQAGSMIYNQYRADDGYPMRIGGSSEQNPVSYTTTATRGEALVAAWGLAVFLNDEKAIERVATGARRNAQFQMRVQYTKENAQLFPRPDRMIGAWGANAAEPYVQIDFVFHNISGLIGLWHLTEEGDVPVAGPIT
jgi:hypothetical protein